GRVHRVAARLPGGRSRARPRLSDGGVEHAARRRGAGGDRPRRRVGVHNFVVGGTRRMMRAGEVAVVTGAGRGIGRAVGRALGGAGARVALLSRTESDVASAAQAIRDGGGEAIALRCDVASADGVTAAFERVQSELGPVDLLVNNAGVGTVAPYEVADYEIAE